MKFPVNLPQPIAGHVRVNLRGADVRMAEQFLDHTQVRAMFQQMRGKTVPQHVRRDVARHPGVAHPILDSQPERHRRERRAAFRQKNVRR